MTEILNELPKLSAEERYALFERLEQLEVEGFEETPEMLEAIDEGRQAMREQKAYTPDEARALVDQWATKSVSSVGLCSFFAGLVLRLCA